MHYGPIHHRERAEMIDAFARQSVIPALSARLAQRRAETVKPPMIFERLLHETLTSLLAKRTSLTTHRYWWQGEGVQLRSEVEPTATKARQLAD